MWLIERKLKVKTEIELHTTGRPRRHGQTEEMRTQIAHIANIIHPIQCVENAEADVSRQPFVFFLPFFVCLEKELLRPAQIDRRCARSLQTVATHTDGPVISYRIVIVIAPGRETVGTAGSEPDRHPKIEPVPYFDRTQQIETMAFIEIGPRPF